MITPSYGLTATERVLPKLALDFTTASLDSRVTFTRAGATATVINSSGNLTTVAADIPRFDFDPTTLVCNGLLIEESRTNGIRNNTMSGAVIGAPGTLPTNWSSSSSPTNGISAEITGTGTDVGVNYIDLRFTGTASATFGFSINTETSGGITATASQTWTNSVYFKLQAGSLNGSIAQLVINEYSAVSAFLRNSFSTPATATTANLLTQRKIFTITTGALTASVQPVIAVAFTSGLTYDFTLRVGLPQMEAGSFATSVISTSTVAVTRNADVATMTGTNFSDWYNASEGAIFTDSQRIATDINASFFNISDNTFNNRISGFTFNAFEPLVSVGGVTQASLNAGGFPKLGIKGVFAYKLNDFAASANGGSVVTDNSGTVPTVDRMYIGANATGSGAFLNGTIKKIFYYPQRLTNAEVQAFSK